MSKKLPEITLSDWLQAEEMSRQDEPMPDGYITVQQYADMRTPKIHRATASVILKTLFEKGMVDRKRWKRGRSLLNVYRLKK